MSSLDAAKADNYYYPPGWDPSSGSLNKLHGRRAWTSRQESANKRGAGQIVRFEVPFNIICGGCGKKIAKGRRFNAEKNHVGNYHSSKIWSFRMHTTCCTEELEVQTDPKECEYVVVKGGKRKEESYDPEDAGAMTVPDPMSKIREGPNDTLSRLEHQEADKRRAQAEHDRLAALKTRSDNAHDDDYTTNKALRRALRGQRREDRALERKRQRIGLPDEVTLHRLSREDEAAARSAPLRSKNPSALSRDRRRSIRNSSVLPPSKRPRVT